MFHPPSLTKRYWLLSREQIMGTKETISDPNNSFNEFEIEKNMANKQGINDVNNVVDSQPLCINY